MKLQRAEQFINEFSTLEAQYAKSDPITLKMIMGSDGQPAIEVMWQGIGDQPAAVAGDAIHAMRSALDLAACDLVASGGGSTKNVYFPFAPDVDGLTAAIKAKNFDRAGPSAVSVLRQLEPFPNGRFMLRELHDLDIRDKHIGLIGTGTKMELSIQGEYSIDDPLSGTFRLHPDTEIIYQFSDGPFDQKPIVPLLRQLKTNVTTAIEMLAGL